MFGDWGQLGPIKGKALFSNIFQDTSENDKEGINLYRGIDDIHILDKVER